MAKEIRKTRTAEKLKKTRNREIRDYDKHDTSSMIDPSAPLRYQDLGLELPALPPTQVVSIRLPSDLLNELRAIGSQMDIPYQALVKLLLAEGVTKIKKKAA